jgi:nitrite reductase/ring-hydroxylating ferredoxin subunit
MVFGMDIRIDDVAGMAHGESRVFEFPRNGRTGQGFLIRYGEEFRAYLNQCSHWLVPLDLGDADFYHAAIDRIACKTHGATFRLEDGACDYGPCFGARLDAYPVIFRGNSAIVTVPD